MGCIPHRPNRAALARAADFRQSRAGYNGAMCAEFTWRLREHELKLGERTVVMGVLNVTPDSFSDGGEFFGTDKAVEQGQRMAAEGAQIIDVGGESTRPGAESVSVDEELARVLPVIEKLRESVSAIISIDTSKAGVARAALDAGAAIINDVTGGRADPEMFMLAAERKAALILMHMQGSPRTMQTAPRYDDVVREVADFFRQQYERALECGVNEMAIAFDPGIGFGKTHRPLPWPRASRGQRSTNSAE